MNTPPYSQFDNHNEESDVSPLLSLNPIDTPPYSPLDLEDDDSIWDNDEDTLLLSPCIDLEKDDNVWLGNNPSSTSTSDIVNGQLRSNLAGLGITAPPSPPLQPTKMLMCNDAEQHQVLNQELCMESDIASPSQSDIQHISLWSDTMNNSIYESQICHDLSFAQYTIESHQHLESIPSADIHALKKLFSCTSCDKRFRRAHDVARHIRKVHHDH